MLLDPTLVPEDSVHLFRWGKCKCCQTIRDHPYKLGLDFVGFGFERRLFPLEALGEFLADYRVGRFLSLYRINLSLRLIFHQRNYARAGFRREGSRALDLVPRCVQNLDALIEEA